MNCPEYKLAIHGIERELELLKLLKKEIKDDNIIVTRLSKETEKELERLK